MSTGTLPRPTAPFTQTHAQPATRGREGLEALFRTPVPPFHMVFPAPEGFGADHALYELHRAANRVYHERIKAYRAKGDELNAPDLVAFIRQDVASLLLATHRLAIGPLELPVYRFLNAKKFWAWLPMHQKQAEARLVEFKKLYRRRRKAW